MERAFGACALSYGSSVLPVVARDLDRWRVRAERIPDASLRRLALDALAKRGNMRGAALFAVLAPLPRRAHAVRALVAFQAAYNYLDTLAEQPSADPVGNGRRLHTALLDALDRDAPGRDYYALCRGAAVCRAPADGGYLLAMLDAARACLAALPSYPLVAPAARAAAARIVDFQALNVGERQGGPDGLERWARAQTPAGSGLAWWETAAAAGSSLGVHVLIGLAAQPRLDPRELDAVERAYFPWIGALHSLLDSVVDVAEDEREGQRNLLGYYASPQHAAERMGTLTSRAESHARALPRGPLHETIVTAMIGHYLSAPSASAAGVREIAAAVTGAGGPLVKPVLALLRAARVGSILAPSIPSRARA